MIKEALDAYAKNTGGKAWSHDRSQTVGASEVGQCARKVFWLKNEGDSAYGAPRDPDYVDGWGARIRGTIMEDQFWEPALRRAYGDRLLFAGKDQRTFVSGFLSATPDGLITHLPSDTLAHLGVKDIGGDCIMTECKTADPRTNLAEAKTENIYQTHVQMGLVREQTEFKPGYSLLSYTDASFWNEVAEFPIKFDPKTYETAKARATLIMTATSAADLKPEGWIAGGRECEYCPFTKACGIQRRSVPEGDAKPDPQFVAEISDLALAIRQIESAGKANDSRLRDLQQQMRDRLRSHGVRKIPGIVSWSNVKGRQAYDNKAIQQAAVAAGIDIEAYSTVGEPTDRLTISITNSASSGADITQAAHAA